MVADTVTFVPPRLRLRQHFATRATTDDATTWLAQAWTRAVLVMPGAGDETVLDLLRTEWDAYRAAHPGEPAVAFRVPDALPEEHVVPGPPPYAEFAPLQRGRYGVEPPPAEDRF